MRRRLLSLAAMAALTTGVAVSGGSAAYAEGGCSGDPITINTGGGAESPSDVFGHEHSTGRHYIKYQYGGYVEWWADNDGGWDGDTADTYYTTTYCA